MLKRNHLLEKLKSGSEPCVGTFSIIPSPVVTDILCESGLDFIIFDGEHGPINFEIAQTMAMICQAHSVSPVMRVSGVDQSEILRALEIGVHGVQVPNLNSVEEASTLIEYAKYPPMGKRGLSPFTRASQYSAVNATEMVKKSNSNTLLNIHIEGALGIENIEQLLEVDSLDIFFLGLFDISSYMGLPGQVEHPEIQKLFKKLVGKIESAGKIVGTISNNERQLKSFIDMGVRYIAHSVDCHLLIHSYKTILSSIR